jgi:lysine/ornithine N-monooxygenase
MNSKQNDGSSWACCLAVVCLYVLVGCGQSGTDVLPAANTPKQAASQLQQAFVSANVEAKNDARTASEALQNADYEKAIQSLQILRARQNLTFDQGMAVYNSMVSLEGKLIAAMEAGDPNAKRAYEALKRSRRN